MEEPATSPSPETTPAQAFALLLETACEDFENLQDLISSELRVLAHGQNEANVSNTEKRKKAFRTLRAPLTIQMALAKSFVFNARRANRVCNLNRGTLGLDRTQRKEFLKATEPLIAVRDVNEHGFDGNGSLKPSMHLQDGGMLDETSLVVNGRDKILMGPLNLYDIYVAVARMRELAGFNALSKQA
jgi:hypothetical protein